MREPQRSRESAIREGDGNKMPRLSAGQWFLGGIPRVLAS